MRNLRYRVGMSQQRLAEEMGVRQQTVSDWETGLHEPRGASLRLLRMIAEREAEYRVEASPKLGSNKVRREE